MGWRKEAGCKRLAVSSSGSRESARTPLLPQALRDLKREDLASFLAALEIRGVSVVIPKGNSVWTAG